MELNFYAPVLVHVNLLTRRAGNDGRLHSLNNRPWRQPRGSELMCSFYGSKGAMISLSHTIGGAWFINIRLKINRTSDHNIVADIGQIRPLRQCELTARGKSGDIPASFEGFAVCAKFFH